MKRVLGMAAVAALYATAPAQAATVKIDMVGNTAVSGTDGNVRSFSGTTGSTTVNVRATGWSQDGTTVRDSYLGAFAQGLGVTSADDLSGLFNLHVVDNDTRADFILLQFDQAVQLTAATLNAFALGTNSYTDTDATVGWGTTATAFGNALNFNNTTLASLNSKLTFQNVSGTSASGSRSLGLTNATGNLWLIGASFNNPDRFTDGFKLSSITLNTVSPVPEPSTWALMLAGFALVGVAMRRAVRGSEQRFTDKVRRIANGVA